VDDYGSAQGNPITEKTKEVLQCRICGRDVTVFNWEGEKLDSIFGTQLSFICQIEFLHLLWCEE